MKTKQKIYMVTTELLLSQTIFTVAETPEAAIEDGDRMFDMDFSDLADDTYLDKGSSAKCERIELWQLETVFERVEESKRVNCGFKLE